jgi:oligoribonuclease
MTEQVHLRRTVWVDLESFGLDETTDPILEVGIEIRDLDFHTVAKETVIVWDDGYDQRLQKLEDDAEHDSDALFVLSMHRKSGLLAEAQSHGVPLRLAAGYLNRFCELWGISGLDPMAGSSVGFDRKMLRTWMPGVDEHFNYRIIDVSSIKETIMRYNPTLYANLPSVVHQKKLHRVHDDIEDSIAEYRFYLEHFMFVDREG